MNDNVLKQIVVQNDAKIVLLVLDGLGGLPHPATGRSELEQADTPHLDRLAKNSTCGLTIPVDHGVTPGSGPGHLSLFGYDPVKYDIGRGILEAVGIDFDIGPNDVAARGNFCTVDEAGRIVDRRAGRIPTEESAPLVTERLRRIRLPGVDVFVEPVREHRFVLVLRGQGLDDRVSGTDPQMEGVQPLPARALAPEAETTADLANRFIAQARDLLSDQPRANMLLLRGFSKYPSIPSFPERYQLRAGAIAAYPMYRGLAKLAGMTPLPGGHSIRDEFAVARENWDRFDFFFIHYKKTDAAGEDGNFDAKVHALEEFDAALPSLLELEPDVVMVAGDHSTPSVMASHSWHPVPFLLHSRWGRPDDAEEFNERECARGAFGTMHATNVMPLAMAHARRFTKYGA